MFIRTSVKSFIIKEIRIASARRISVSVCIEQCERTKYYTTSVLSSVKKMIHFVFLFFLLVWQPTTCLQR